MRCKQSDVYIPLAAWHLSLTSTIGALRISCIPGPHGIQKKTSSRYTRFLRNRWDRPSPCVVCHGWLRQECRQTTQTDRKSTRLNSSHRCISYAVFCLKKKNNT